MSDVRDERTAQHGRVAGKMVLLAFGMFGFGYLMVPLYDIICDITGLNGKTGRVSESEVASYGLDYGRNEGGAAEAVALAANGPVSDLAGESSSEPVLTDTATVAPEADVRQITVEFVASVNSGGSWGFTPAERTMLVEPGKLYQSTYHAENQRSEPIVGQATPSVTPFAAARYFNKTECFCFTRQAFGPAGTPEGSKEMPLTFVIDPDLPVNVDRVTLSYTFFDSPDQS